MGTEEFMSFFRLPCPLISVAKSASVAGMLFALIAVSISLILQEHLDILQQDEKGDHAIQKFVLGDLEIIDMAVVFGARGVSIPGRTCCWYSLHPCTQPMLCIYL
jgi:hypothetical protein